MRIRSVIVMFLGVASCLAATARGAPAESFWPPQGYFRTRLPDSLPRAAWELTSGVTRVEGERPPFFSDIPDAVRDAWRLPIDLEYGLGAGGEVRLETGGQHVEERGGGDASGVLDARISFAWEFPVERFRAAGVLLVKLPNASEEKRLGTDETDVVLSGAVGYAARTWGWSGNLGLGILGNPTVAGTQDDVLVLGAAGWLRPRGPAGWTLFAEVDGQAASRFGNDFRTAGIGVILGTRVPIGLALRFGLTSVSPDRGIDLRVTLPPR